MQKRETSNNSGPFPSLLPPLLPRPVLYFRFSNTL